MHQRGDDDEVGASDPAEAQRLEGEQQAVRSERADSFGSGESTNLSEAQSISSSSSSSLRSEKTFVETVGEQILVDGEPEVSSDLQQVDDEMRGREFKGPARGHHKSTTIQEPPPPQAILSSSSSGSSSSTFKRYKFGLTNHFLTMPDVEQSATQLNRNYQKRGLLSEAPISPTVGPKKQRNRRSRGEVPKPDEGRNRRAVQQQQQRQQGEDEDEESDCDLSVLPPSSPDVNSLLSHESNWEPHERREHAQNTHENSTTEFNNLTESSQLTQSSSDGGDGGHTHKNKMNYRQEKAGAGGAGKEARLLPAGDAGLDASRCNSKAHNGHTNPNNRHRSQSANALANDCYLADSDGFLQHSNLPSPHHSPSGHHLEQRHNNLASSPLHHHHQLKAQHHYLTTSEDDQDHHHHHLREKKKLELSGELEDECASNGLLVRLSSIMYATFLVILGCILHVSELKQKSRNSSDHIYTTVVALLGIFWLLFLQSDLQRYKRYASKFILLESIFNDHHNQQQQQQQVHRLAGSHHAGGRGAKGQAALISAGSSTSGLLGLDPSARSTTSSSASLVNDRMSMNTEVIFKKTAYKMYQQQAAAALAGVPPPGRAHLARGGASSTKHHHLGGGSFEPPPQTINEEPPARLVPAYKFLHGKMGANFYLKCGMAAFCFGHVIHEGLRFGQQVYFFATGNLHCRDSAALVAHLVTPLYSFYQLFMMFKYSNLVINRHKILARFGLMHIIGTCVTFWFRTILEEAFEDFVHKMDYFKAHKMPYNQALDPTDAMHRDPHKHHIPGGVLQGGGEPSNAGLVNWLGSLASLTASESAPAAQQSAGTSGGNWTIDASQLQPAGNFSRLAQSTLLALMSSPMSATITPQIVRHLPDSYHCAQNTLLTTKSMNALPYLYPFTIEYNLLIAATFLSLYFNIGKLGGGGSSSSSSSSSGRNESPHSSRCYLACCRPLGLDSLAPSPSAGGRHFVSKQPSNSSTSNLAASYLGSQMDLAASESNSYTPHHHHHHQVNRYNQHMEEKFGGEYKSNFVVNADCHAANKGLFLGFFVLLVTLVTIVIFFVTINKPSHLQLGIKINLIQEATLTSLILVVTLAGYRQIMRLNQNPLIKNTITTDDVLMLIPLPFFFIHSLLSFRAETATLYSPHHLTKSLHHPQAHPAQQVHHHQLAGDEGRALALKLEGGNSSSSSSSMGRQATNSSNQPASFMLGLASGLNARNSSSDRNSRNTSSFSARLASNGSSGALPAAVGNKDEQNSRHASKIDHYKLLTIALNLAVMIEVLVQTNFIIDGLRRCSESRYLRFKKPGRELITFAIILNITYWIVATFETKSVEQYKTEIDYYGPLPYMFISHTTLPVMLFYRYHSSVCLAEIWNRAYKPPKRR